MGARRIGNILDDLLHTAILPCTSHVLQNDISVFRSIAYVDARL